MIFYYNRRTCTTKLLHSMHSTYTCHRYMKYCFYCRSVLPTDCWSFGKLLNNMILSHVSIAINVYADTCLNILVGRNRFNYSIFVSYIFIFLHAIFGPIDKPIAYFSYSSILYQWYRTTVMLFWKLPICVRKKLINSGCSLFVPKKKKGTYVFSYNLFASNLPVLRLTFYILTTWFISYILKTHIRCNICKL